MRYSNVRYTAYEEKIFYNVYINNIFITVFVFLDLMKTAQMMTGKILVVINY